jgi:Invasion associated locus B (IalB) protein
MISRILPITLALGAALTVSLPPAVARAQATHPHVSPAPAAKPQAPASPAQSEPADNHLGDSQGWSAYADPDRSGKICYLVGRPVKSEPHAVKRGDVYMYVTHRSAEHTYNVVSFNAGYTFKEGSDAELTIDNTRFDLFTNKDTAWARDAETEKAIVDAMVKGRQATIKGTSARGTTTTDTYALAGFSQVLVLIDKACGLKR